MSSFKPNIQTAQTVLKDPTKVNSFMNWVQNLSDEYITESLLAVFQTLEKLENCIQPWVPVSSLTTEQLKCYIARFGENVNGGWSWRCVLQDAKTTRDEHDRKECLSMLELNETDMVDPNRYKESDLDAIISEFEDRVAESTYPDDQEEEEGSENNNEIKEEE